MTVIIQQNVRCEQQGAPIPLDRRRRRLSTIVRRHARSDRAFIVSVHRKGEPWVPSDATVRFRSKNPRFRNRTWAQTLVGPEDDVVITYLPLGGGGGNSRQAGKQIGLAVGAIALMALGQFYLAPMLAGAAGISAAAAGTIVSLGTAGIIAGASYLVNRASQTKDKEEDDTPLYGVSGGGNKPRPGDRIPRRLGHTFATDLDLTQPDYVINDGEDQILFKRATLGVGRYSVQKIEIGKATLWTVAGGVRPPFIGAEVEIIPPGGTSSLVPATVRTSPDVASQQLPRPGENPDWAGPFLVDATSSGGTLMLSHSVPNGVSSTYTKNGASRQTAGVWGIRYEIAPADANGNPAGPFQELWDHRSDWMLTTKAIRETRFFGVGAGRWLIRAQNPWGRNDNIVNDVVWDGLSVQLADTIVRPHVTEIAIKVRSGKSLGITAFSDITVESIAVLPVWNGASWQEQATRKAVWAFADVLRGHINGYTYGAGLADNDIDVARLLHYASTVTEFDTFDGSIRGPVSVFEAASTILGVMRAEPARIGNAWSITRDEPRTVTRRHVFSRRQIQRGSTTKHFKIALSDGAADVIGEYAPDGDPRRLRQVRRTFGAMSLTPRRLSLTGITDYAHAMHYVTWVAACAYYRRKRTKATVELSGRLVQRNDPAVVDAFFMTPDTKAAGVMERSGFTLTLDGPVDVSSGDKFAVFRNRKNLQWGPCLVTQGAAPEQIVVNADDAAANEAFFGISFSDVFANDNEDMTSVLVGPAIEVQDPYIIQSVEPQGRDSIAIEAVEDSPMVWTALGEAIPPEPPISGVGDVTTPTVPVVPWVRAQPIQKTASLDMDWSCGTARGAASYIVDISYDDWATSERASEGMSTSGSYQIRHQEGITVAVRAFAVNAEGVPGPVVHTSFRTFKPVLSNDIVSLEVTINDLVAQVRHDIDQIAAVGEGTVRGALSKLNDQLQQLAADVSLGAATDYQARELIRVSLGDALAAISRETELRVTNQEAVAKQLTTMLARLGSNEAALVDERTTRATADSALSSSITALSTTVGQNTAALSTYGASIDGMKVQWGVTGTINGTTGGFLFQGIRRLDGQISYSVQISGSLVVDGTVTAPKLQVSQLAAITTDTGLLRTGRILSLNGYLDIDANAPRIAMYS